MWQRFGGTPAKEDALPGRPERDGRPRAHFVNGAPLGAALPRRAARAPSSAWAASGAPSGSSGSCRACLRTAVGYAGGTTPNPTYGRCARA